MTATIDMSIMDGRGRPRRSVRPGAPRWLAAFVAAVLFCAGALGAPVRPNIVFILVDDLGAHDLAVTGSTYYETPNIDRLAAEGVRFTHAYSAAPTCSPTRAALLTGRYPHRLHITAAGPGWKDKPQHRLASPDWIKYVRRSEFTYAEAFQAAGYRTAHIGKWHVGGDPADHGFDRVVPFTRVKDFADPWQVERYTRAAERFIEDNRHRPFLLTISHGTVHVPLYEKPEHIAVFRDRPPSDNGQRNPVMAAMIRTLDESVGRILDKLRALDLDESTVVVFTSDNGGWQGATSNLPLRGGKGWLYEGGIRIPLIIRWHGQARAGLLVSEPVVSTDLYPTFLGMAGLPPRPAQHLDGLDLTPLLRGARDAWPRHSLYFHYPHYHVTEPHSAVISDRWKLIHYYDTGRSELFDLKSDIGEHRDLAASRPAIAARLQCMLDRHLDAIGAQRPIPNPGFDRGRGVRMPYVGRRDLLEDDERLDPRKYVADPDRDYGAGWTLDTPLPRMGCHRAIRAAGNNGPR